MPNVADLIRAPKSKLKLGSWKTGKIPSTSFPLKKGGRAFPCGPDWAWRLCEFEAMGYQCRVLIRLNEGKHRFHSVLSIDDGRNIKVICHHDYHPPEKHWHCHFASGNIDEIYPGVLRDISTFRVYEAFPSKANNVNFDLTQSTALSIAARRYRFEAKGDLI